MPKPMITFRDIGIHFDDVVARIKMVTDAETNNDVRQLLDMTSTNFWRNLETDAVPMPRVMKLALDKGLSLDFLIKGEKENKDG